MWARRRRRRSRRGTAALNAGTDMEMVSTNFRDFGKQLLAQHRMSMTRLDDAVRRILRVKFRAGLFDHPYVDQTKATIESSFVTAPDRPAARRPPASRWSCSRTTAPRCRSTVQKSVAVIGPLGDDQHDMLGPWWGQGQDADAVSLFTGIKAQDPNTTFTEGCTDGRQRSLRPGATSAPTSRSRRSPRPRRRRPGRARARRDRAARAARPRCAATSTCRGASRS